MLPELECSWSSRVSNQRKLLSLRGPLTTLFSHSKEGGGGGVGKEEQGEEEDEEDEEEGFCPALVSIAQSYPLCLQIIPT